MNDLYSIRDYLLMRTHEQLNATVTMKKDEEKKSILNPSNIKPRFGSFIALGKILICNRFSSEFIIIISSEIGMMDRIDARILTYSMTIHNFIVFETIIRILLWIFYKIVDL